MLFSIKSKEKHVTMIHSKEVFEMITLERYEIIKKWGNYLFMFHGKEANEINKGKLKNILDKMILTTEFQWKPIPQTKGIEVSFALGSIEVHAENQYFMITMDAETRNRLQTFKSEQQTEKETEPKETIPETQEVQETYENISPKVETKQEETLPISSTSPVQTKPKKQEFVGESVFLGFIDESDEELMIETP